MLNAALGLCGSAQAIAPAADHDKAQLADIVREASARFGLPERWIRAVIAAESGGDRRAVSPKGAMGLMQIMPETWNALRAQHDLGADPFDVRDNVLAGSAYLRGLHDRFGFSGFLAAYNAGPGRYVAFREGRSALPTETLAYVARVRRLIGPSQALAPSGPIQDAVDWRRSGLFVERPAAEDQAGSAIAPASVRP